LSPELWLEVREGKKNIPNGGEKARLSRLGKHTTNARF
jgi:hypothetical protein